MATAKPLSALVLFAGILGAASCTDNPAAYEGILGPSEESTSASSGGTSWQRHRWNVLRHRRHSRSAGCGRNERRRRRVPPAAVPVARWRERRQQRLLRRQESASPPGLLPPCYLAPTLAGEEILKGTPCTSADIKLCYRSCGPNQAGWKTETCTAGVYAEGDCRFPADGDYACYKIPDVIDEAACGVTAPPAATDPCEAPPCTTCNVDGFYTDTAGDAKEGFCICRDPDEMGVRRWTCASATAWPCPVSRGC